MGSGDCPSNSEKISLLESSLFYRGISIKKEDLYPWVLNPDGSIEGALNPGHTCLCGRHYCQGFKSPPLHSLKNH